ncbi:LysR family transcriptional regulator [Catenulispora sp. NF23]|uniref:LysR family transcriptional regulator n=1 Tax=Catenulispora pinistramenti TaxID=2705254 RepID=UPI001BADA5F0|nr:LysR family transcriptional regulator [Catenulispora pinistramenti]MBS2537440.1 LysR family transcriptional regulator [Catenulispora pinistramenti]
MEDRLVRAFVAVADHGTFGAAAQTLAVTQPALTKQIQALEARIGGALFRRGRLGARLTPLGRTLLPDARDAVDRLDAFELRAKRLTAGGAGRLALGFGLSTIDIAPRAVAEFRRRNPDVGVTLDDMATAIQLERLRRGQLDAGFARLPVDPDLSVLELGTDQLMLAVPGNADTEPGVRELIARHGLVTLVQTKGPGFVNQVQRYLAAEGIKPRVVQRANDLQTVIALVAAGVGVALVSARAPVVVAPERIRWLTIDHEAARWGVGVVWGGGEPGPALAAFLEVTRELAASGW